MLCQALQRHHARGNVCKLRVHREVLCQILAQTIFLGLLLGPNFSEVCCMDLLHTRRTAAIISWSGSSTMIMPSGLFSVKYKREASSSASCHSSCHKMATLMSSRLTNSAFKVHMSIPKRRKAKHYLVTYLINDHSAMLAHPVHYQDCSRLAGFT